MNYRIVGADGKVYGPAGVEHIRQWLAEGRASGRTPVHVEGAAEWTRLELLPEFAAQAQSATPKTIGALSASAAPAGGTNGFAVAGLICGVLAWAACCCCLPFNLLGVIFSIIALVQINSQSPPQEGRWLAIIGLVLSVASLFIGFAMWLWQMLADPGTFSFQTSSF
jgi:hypothetical protein